MPTVKQLTFANAVLNGASYVDAAKEAKYSEKSNPHAIAKKVIRAGLLPDPTKQVERVAEIEAIQEQAHRELVKHLNGEREEIFEALVDAATSGNSVALKEALDRLVGPIVRKVAPTTPDGSGEWQPMTNEQLAAELNALYEMDG